MASRRRAKAIARKVSRKAYRGARRMSKGKLARVYATKCGQVAYRSALRLKSRRRRRRVRRFRRFRRRY